MTTLTLIRTAPEFPPGSMPGYAALVAEAMADMDGWKVRTVYFFDPNGGGSMRRHHWWRLRHAMTFFQRNPSDLYHLLDGSMAGFLPSHVWKKTVITVHDLVPLLQLHGRLSGSPGVMGRLLIHRMVKVLRKVGGITSVSGHTAGDLLEFTARSDVSVIHHPVRSFPVPNHQMELPSRYLFHIGNNADYKNRAGVLDVFARLQDLKDLHLIMAGPAPTKELRHKAASVERVQFKVDVSDSELSELYTRAAVFLFPSRYEGFGMPVLEAMAAGCPVICSDAAALPEVVGNAARVAPVEDVGQWASLCRQLLNDAALRDELIARGRVRASEFSMQRLSDELSSCYSRFLKQIGGTT
jgi:glycosyltransferase involved in cell wall biosynthesis